MNMIGAYLMIGIGVAAGIHCVMAEKKDWAGATKVAGLVMACAFWPAVLSMFVIMALAAWADQ